MLLLSAYIVAPALVVTAGGGCGYAQSLPISMQEREKELSVLTRTNPAYDSMGARFAGLVLNASLTNSVEYKDNLYSKETDKTEDLLHKISPAIEVKSDFSRHFISASLRAERGSYKKNSGENYTDYSVRIAGRADVLSDIHIPASIEYSKKHAQRSDPEDQNEVKPTLYNELIFNTGLDYKGANIDLLIEANIKNVSFKDNYTPSAFIDNSDRNRNEYTVSVNTGLTKNRALSPFVFAQSRNIKYDRSFDDNGFRRSSTGFIGGFGLNINPRSKLLNSVVRIGYVSRSFDDSRFSDINALIYSANIGWEPSTLLALDLSGKREIIESTLNNLSASIDDIFDVSAYYELAPNIFLNPKLSYTVKNYRGNLDRELKKFSGAMNVNYKVNSKLWISSTYNYVKQKENENNVSLNNFDSNLYNISMKLQI